MNHWPEKRVPYCSATDVVVLQPMHWKDNRVTTSIAYWSTDLGFIAPVLCQWWWAGEAGLTCVDVGHSHEPPQSAAFLLQFTEELVTSLPRCEREVTSSPLRIQYIPDCPCGLQINMRLHVQLLIELCICGMHSAVQELLCYVYVYLEFMHILPISSWCLKRTQYGTL